ncbi:MAG: 5-dehydro-4-deoxy-D-glucuronate isomerase [candidate division KSB1 bacterium]|nr:5-dehydro-4-deoxy-D-glucuronate isomerase [candidate division KSB1 bacterium]MDZ7336630.1 5-dehydro-4-deoxy-D-glucuronate isomerase [candidate division KSB1 bacterium]MDZ7376137.1 5-dehydro-4-deoxy-D-glucuronate isomerase [candidate division KSB1 bacterium]MDZ7401116.1 5-dehydro-4-deoxy-D-glucuronate isomerase [candidate division KSB1 bacterium]
MEIRYLADPVRFQRMTTQEIRESFLVETLFQPETIYLLYVDVDRAIIGSAVPGKKALELSVMKELGTEYFCERREIGVLNIGGKGKISVDGQNFELDARDGLYIGKGSKAIHFSSNDPEHPAAFYLLSFPAHTSFPTQRARIADAEAVHLGSSEAANRRTIYKYIHPRGIPSCQVVMGFTVLEPGSVWNTMPPHTHERRMEVYLYFDMAPDSRVFHLMGTPNETRHIVVADRQAVISPSWSIHSGVGTGAYTFCWGMGGENQTFEDMDGIEIGQIK